MGAADEPSLNTLTTTAERDWAVDCMADEEKATDVSREAGEAVDRVEVTEEAGEEGEPRAAVAAGREGGGGSNSLAVEVSAAATDGSRGVEGAGGAG